MGRGVRHGDGGIAGLVDLIDEHGGALEYDLMTRAGATLEDIPARIPWTALRSFATHLDAGSALVSEIRPELAGWQGDMRVPMILADMYDLIAMLRHDFDCANTPKKKGRPRKPAPYPRPGANETSVGQRIGKDAIPIKDFDEWWEGGGADG